MLPESGFPVKHGTRPPYGGLASVAIAAAALSLGTAFSAELVTPRLVPITSLEAEAEWTRADRLYVKLYEEETNLRAYFLVDSSNSMRYASGAMDKYDYGCTLAASLTHLLLNQRDACGLVLFDSAVRAEAMPRSTPEQLGAICRLRADYCIANTSEPLELSLARFLVARLSPTRGP